MANTRRGCLRGFAESPLSRVRCLRKTSWIGGNMVPERSHASRLIVSQNERPSIPEAVPSSIISNSSPMSDSPLKLRELQLDDYHKGGDPSGHGSELGLQYAWAPVLLGSNVHGSVHGSIGSREGKQHRW